MVVAQMSFHVVLQDLLDHDYRAASKHSECLFRGNVPLRKAKTTQTEAKQRRAAGIFPVGLSHVSDLNQSLLFIRLRIRYMFVIQSEQWEPQCDRISSAGACPLSYRVDLDQDSLK